MLYYDDGGHRRHHTLGAGSLNKTEAEKRRDQFMRTLNGGNPEQGGLRPVLLRDFVDQKYLPFQRGKWKNSTRGTSENRILHHIVKGLGDTHPAAHAEECVERANSGDVGGGGAGGTGSRETARTGANRSQLSGVQRF